MADKVEKGSQVSIHYTLHAGEQLIESSKDQQPLTYEHGAGQIVPGLEEEIDGMEQGESKKVTLEPEQAYGPHNPEAVRAIPKESFQDASQLNVGDRVAGQADGQEFQATVTEVGDETVTLDFNHPLAGQTLQFDIEVVKVG